MQPNPSVERTANGGARGPVLPSAVPPLSAACQMLELMDASSISQYINSTFADIHPVAAWGETSFFYNPGRKLPRGIYFATLKDKDGDNDRASNLQRQAVFRYPAAASGQGSPFHSLCAI